jgi:LacI family transcriptional regulator
MAARTCQIFFREFSWLFKKWSPVLHFPVRAAQKDKRMNRTPRLSDVAKRAGVSISTISRALQDKSQLDPRTYDRVARAVKDLEYTKKTRRRPAVGHRSVAVIVPSVLDPFFCVLLHGIDSVAKTYGCNILFLDSDNSTEVETKNIHRLSDSQIDGAILVPSGSKLQGYELLREMGVHVVLADRTLEADEASWVVSNDEEGAYLATKYLVDLGHRSILYVGGTHATSTERARMAGYKRALRENGITVRPGLITECSFDSQSAHAAMRQILKAGDPVFTAAFAGSDLIAFGIRKAMEEKGLKVPRDVSLIGYGDMPISSLLSLTSVSCPAYEMGKSALTLLLNMVEHKYVSSRRVMLRPTLVLRSSCRRLKGA